MWRLPLRPLLGWGYRKDQFMNCTVLRDADGGVWVECDPAPVRTQRLGFALAFSIVMLGGSVFIASASTIDAPSVAGLAVVLAGPFAIGCSLFLSDRASVRRRLAAALGTVL